MRLLISNLNRCTTASQLIRLLLPFGLVRSARIVMDNQSGYSDGMALVEIEYRAGNSIIKELDNSRFMNYFIRVEETNLDSNDNRIW